MNTNELIRETLLDITADKGYNACLAEELTGLVRERILPPEDMTEEDFNTLCGDTITHMIDEKELGYSGRGNIVSGAGLGYLIGTFRANAKGFGFLTPDTRYAELYEEDLFVGADSTGGAMNGDTVMVRVSEGRRDDRRGAGNRGGRGDRGVRRMEASVIRIPDPVEPEARRKTEFRTLCRCVVEVPDGDSVRPVAVYASHFGLSKIEQEHAVSTAETTLRDERLPAVLMGDFNVTPDDPVLAPLNALLNGTDELLKGEFSFPSDKPGIKIDYIYTTKNITPVRAEIVNVVASDHCPVWADLEL